jgi:hypothetical protein
MTYYLQVPQFEISEKIITMLCHLSSNVEYEYLNERWI